jgi:hypothetical protein
LRWPMVGRQHQRAQYVGSHQHRRAAHQAEHQPPGRRYPDCRWPSPPPARSARHINPPRRRPAATPPAPAFPAPARATGQARRKYQEWPGQSDRPKSCGRESEKHAALSANHPAAPSGFGQRPGETPVNVGATRAWARAAAPDLAQRRGRKTRTQLRHCRRKLG